MGLIRRCFFLLVICLSLLLIQWSLLLLLQWQPHRSSGTWQGKLPSAEDANEEVQARGQFCVLFNFTRAKMLDRDDDSSKFSEEPNSSRISLAVHCSLHFAHKLHVQAQHWDGPISAAVLVRPGEESALNSLLFLWHCSRWMRLRVSLHLLWRKAPFQPSCGGGSANSQIIATKFACKREGNSNPEMLDGALPWPPLRYPINTLRNVARLGASPLSRVHLVADVENIFSVNFTQMVDNFVERIVSNKELFVFRRFEVEEGESLPNDVEQLTELLRRRRAFPFHRHFFPVAHGIRGLSDWLNYSLQQGSKVRASHLSFRNAAFEPQFLMAADAPLHFEAVPARLYDHQVLLLELCRAGFRLRLLSHVFNVHLGVRRNLTEAETLIKQIAAGQSWRLTEQFREYLERKYGKENDGGNCPNFWDRFNIYVNSNNSKIKNLNIPT